MLAVSELDGLIFFLNGVSEMLSFVTLGHRKLGMSVHVQRACVQESVHAWLMLALLIRYPRDQPVLMHTSISTM